MKTKKILLSIAILIVVVGIFAMYKIWGSLDKIIVAGIETYGTEITGAKVSVDGISLDVTNGSAALNGLTVGNPEGFKTDYAIKLEQAQIVIDIESLTSDLIIIEEVRVQGPSLIYEMASGGSNIDRLAENAQSHGGASNNSNEAADKGEGPRLIIENFRVNDGELNVSHKILKGKTMTLALPDIHLEDIGKESNGASPGEITEEIMASIKNGAGTAIATSSISDSIGAGADAVKKGADSVVDTAKGAGEKIKGLFK